MKARDLSRASSGMTTRSSTTPAPASSSIRPRRSSRCPSCTPRTPSGSGTSAPPFATARSPTGSNGARAATPAATSWRRCTLPAYIDSVEEFCAAGGGNITQSTPVVARSWDAALAAAGTALEATAAVLDGRLRPGVCARAPAGAPRPAGPGRRVLPVLERGACSRAGAPPRRRAGRRPRLGRASRKRHAGVLLGPGRRPRRVAPHAARLLGPVAPADRRARRGRRRRRRGPQPERRAPRGHR